MRSPVAPSNPKGGMNEPGNESDAAEQNFGFPMHDDSRSGRLYLFKVVGEAEPDYHYLVDRGRYERRG